MTSCCYRRISPSTYCTEPTSTATAATDRHRHSDLICNRENSVGSMSYYCTRGNPHLCSRAINYLTGSHQYLRIKDTKFKVGWYSANVKVAFRLHFHLFHTRNLLVMCCKLHYFL